MNTSVKKMSMVVLVTLVAGLLLGWLIFGGSGNTDAHEHMAEESDGTIWTCSMHPQIRQNEPGDCPICGMDLIPLDDEESTAGPLDISMSPTAMQLASIVTRPVGQSGSSKRLRLTGKIQEDERLIYSQTSHIPGRIERLMVNFTGEYVRRGQAIAYIYSPELVTAQEELLAAYEIKDGQPQLYQAAREKLKNWKLTDNQIDQLVSGGTTREQFPITADRSGYVTEKMVNLGDYISRGQTIYEIADLSRVWVLFDLYENDLQWVKPGDNIKFTVASNPGKEYTATIEYIDPVIDPKTRVAKARVVMNNKDLSLKPETLVSGQIDGHGSSDHQQLTIPETAVLWTGRRSVVYIKTGSQDGAQFRMREIVLGPDLGDQYVVESGLTPGEEIVVNGTFSVDAAAQLAGKPSMMSPEVEKISSQHVHPHHETPTVNEATTIYTVHNTFKAQLKDIFNSYLKVKDALVDGNTAEAKGKANTLTSTIDQVDMSLVKGDAHQAWMVDRQVLQSASEAISQASDLKAMRLMLSPLSDQLYFTLKKYQVKVKGYRQYCPMAMDNQGAFWLSNEEQVINPYFGEVMLTCGEVTDTLINETNF